MAADASTVPPTFRLLVVAPLAGDPDAKPGVVPVDKDGFDQVVARVAPTLAVRVDAPGGGPEIEATLRFECWRDLTPIGVVEQVPLLRGLLEARGLAERHRRGDLDENGLAEGLGGLLPAPVAQGLVARASASRPSAGDPGSAGADTPPAPDAEEGGLDAILDMVDTGPRARSSGSGASVAGRIAGAVASGGRRRRRAGAAGSGLTADIDRLLGLSLDAVLHQPGFRALERAWRGLRFLVQRIDFRAPIELHVTPADLAGAADAINASGGEEDYDVVVSAHELDASVRDHATAREIAEAGAAIQTPVLAGVTPGFLGLSDWSELERSRDPAAVFGEPSYAAWRSLRGDDRSRYLVLLANRVALRAPFGRDGERARDLEYEERGEDAGLFGAAAWAVASVLARAWARTGACVQIAGTRHGLVPDLPLVPGSGDRPLPVEGGFGSERREDLEKIGLSVLQGYQRDVAFVGVPLTFHEPERYPDAEASADAAQQATLAYQLFATRFVKFLGRTLPELIGLASRDEATGTLRSRVVEFLTTPAHRCPPDHVAIAMDANPDDPAITDITLRVQPELTLGGRPVNVMLGFSLRL